MQQMCLSKNKSILQQNDTLLYFLEMILCSYLNELNCVPNYSNIPFINISGKEST